MREEGRLKWLEDKWFTNNYQSSFIPEDTHESDLKVLTLDNLHGLFIVSVTSKAIALSIFLIFIIRKKICSKDFILRIFSARYMRIMMRYLFPKNTNMIHDVNVEMTHVNPH